MAAFFTYSQRRLLAAACASLALALPAHALARPIDPVETLTVEEPSGEPVPPESGTGWSEFAGELYWFDDGVMARDKQVFDPASKAWYWFDADGTMARGKDVFIPMSNEDRSHGKWVRYDADGHMVKGQDYLYGAWYHFDDITGEMTKGFTYLESDQKWVYYDLVTGRMLTGEQAIDGQWYYLDEQSGAVTYGWHRFEGAGKTVFYTWPSGAMAHGAYEVNGIAYHFDEVTGALDASQQAPEPMLSAGMVSPISLGEGIADGSVTSARIIGDSIMAGVGALGYERPDGDELFTYRGTTYREPSKDTDCASNRLRAYLASRDVDMVNASVPGLGSMHVYSQVGEEVLGDEDLAIVVVGANDRGSLDSTATLEEFRANAEEFLTVVAKHYDGNMIVLSPIPVVSEDYNFTLREESDILSDLCEEHGWAFASLYDAYMATLVVQGLPASLFYTDGTHPNRLGQELLWDTLCRVLDLDASQGGGDWPSDPDDGETPDDGSTDDGTSDEGEPGDEEVPDGDSSDADGDVEDTPDAEGEAGSDADADDADASGEGEGSIDMMAAPAALSGGLS